MLRPHEPPPVEVLREDVRSRLVLVCDHASNRIPEALGTLGVSDDDRATHIGWDIGAAVVARHMSALLDAPLVLAGYSRLAVDVNRPTDAPSAMPEVSGGVPIPGNHGLDEAARAARIQAMFAPYHAAITRLLDARAALPGGPVLLAIHSFTPELLGQKRPWHVGTLYGVDARLARAFYERLVADPALCVGDNEPYRVSKGSDYTLPVHGEERGILHTAIEIRQDGVASEEGARGWAERLAGIWGEIIGSLGAGTDCPEPQLPMP
ncbi:MAG: N-formylglutamate amidohydrolase [Byssovorax sp.]